ncbi:methyl-accepting chemotaxis protein [Pararhodospirillum oryzae]|uniref:Chemotaxis protein n=1 Tax=Pararhodospirillum oryzae TaxID=478448 RepID=A0A512H744_9PROT|nr:PAS domain-containing methyl-accepting chemotaxis protein [Pararhodospirillum oryzae]GEO81248.1 hypothetical protein ROR02_13790 [Pararhodospirillum oryzae]
MLGFSGSRLDNQAVLDALDRSQAVIEFKPDGTVLKANKNFLELFGYTASEIEGKSHEIFVEPAFRGTPEYRDFWQTLQRGQYQRARFKRLGKGGREVWIEASYNPVLASDGSVRKVVKYATDITASRMQFADLLGKVNAITRSQAVIEFDLDATVLDANQNFLQALGYTLDEIKGKPHRIFVESAYAVSPEYQSFWERLRRGEYQAGRFKRLGKGGREIWIEASYNPIFDLNQKVCKVVKFATDITAQMALLADLKRLIDVNLIDIERAIEETDHQSQGAARAAGETLATMQTLAASTEEMAVSVGEISGNMAQSLQATNTAFERMEEAGQSAERLAKAAVDMGGIVSLIQDIAAQINLLALNATIEAARAGEAGKGFAVVAGEVKNLANQAARATDQISREIDAVQGISTDVVASLSTVGTSITSVRELVTTISSAVEEQSVVNRDMSSHMQLATDAVGTISDNIEGILKAIDQVGAALDKTKEAAVVLAN